MSDPTLTPSAAPIRRAAAIVGIVVLASAAVVLLMLGYGVVG
jgi:hypothetical protein